MEAALSQVRLDDKPNDLGMRNDFESMVAFVSSIADPPKKKHQRNGYRGKRGYGSISDLQATVADVQADSANATRKKKVKFADKSKKNGRGSSGVEYCFHTQDEYRALNDE